jgi:DNA-binding IclR family transcriptional regulator
MARPILGRDGAAVGTVSVAGPSSRFTLERMKQIAPDLAATVNEIADLWPARRVMDFVSGNNAIRVASNA